MRFRAPPSETSIDRFYGLHHRIAAIAPAALLAYSFCAQIEESRRSEFKTLANAAEEIKARSTSAIILDFRNSVYVGDILTRRSAVEVIRRT